MQTTVSIAVVASFVGIEAQADGTISIEVEVSPNGSGRCSYLGYLAVTREQ